MILACISLLDTRIVLFLFINNCTYLFSSLLRKLSFIVNILNICDTFYIFKCISPFVVISAANLEFSLFRLIIRFVKNNYRNFTQWRLSNYPFKERTSTWLECRLCGNIRCSFSNTNTSYPAIRWIDLDSKYLSKIDLRPVKRSLCCFSNRSPTKSRKTVQKD